MVLGILQRSYLSFAELIIREKANGWLTSQLGEVSGFTKTVDRNK